MNLFGRMQSRCIVYVSSRFSFLVSRFWSFLWLLCLFAFHSTSLLTSRRFSPRRTTHAVEAPCPDPVQSSLEDEHRDCATAPSPTAPAHTPPTAQTRPAGGCHYTCAPQIRATRRPRSAAPARPVCSWPIAQRTARRRGGTVCAMTASPPFPAVRGRLPPASPPSPTIAMTSSRAPGRKERWGKARKREKWVKTGTNN